MIDCRVGAMAVEIAVQSAGVLIIADDVSRRVDVSDQGAGAAWGLDWCVAIDSDPFDSGKFHIKLGAVRHPHCLFLRRWALGRCGECAPLSGFLRG